MLKFSVSKTIVHNGALVAAAGILLAFGGTLINAEDRFGDDDHDRAYTGVKSGKLKSLSTILKIARRRVKGRVAGVSLVRRGTKLVYRVKILKKNGRLVNVYIDAGSRARVQVNRKGASRRDRSRRGERGRKRSDRDDDRDDSDDRHDRDRNDDEDSGGRDEDSDGRGRGEDRDGRDH